MLFFCPLLCLKLVVGGGRVGATGRASRWLTIQDRTTIFA